MSEATAFVPAFVEFIPNTLEPGVIYVSIRFRTVSHLCASGCGEEITTHLGRHDWTLEYDGSVSLRPSIGNFDLPCRSHYFIRHNKVVWVRDRWRPARIDNATSTMDGGLVQRLWRRLLRTGRRPQ